jgi:YVTN family beta-propeller protein
MKIGKLFILTLFLSSTVLMSCSDNESKPKGKFQTGVFVTNEGNFRVGNGTVSHYNFSTKETTQDLFGAINSQKALGDVVQAMTLDGDNAYIVVNNSNKIEVVNANTFESLYTISDLHQPRYFITFNGKGYVSEWGLDNEVGRVSIIDLKTHSVTGNVTTDFGAENLIALNNKIYVSNNFMNTISVIDPSTNTVVSTIETGSSPSSFLIDSENKLWVVCTGGYDGDYNPLSNGQLQQIDPGTNTVIKTIELHQNVLSHIGINKSKTGIFYCAGSSVFKIKTSDTTAPASPFITAASLIYLYGFGIDPQTEMLYLADAKAFSSNGTVYRYNIDGTAADQFTAGIAPNGFVFKY